MCRDKTETKHRTHTHTADTAHIAHTHTVTTSGIRPYRGRGGLRVDAGAVEHELVDVGAIEHPDRDVTSNHPLKPQFGRSIGLCTDRKPKSAAEDHGHQVAHPTRHAQGITGLTKRGSWVRLLSHPPVLQKKKKKKKKRPRCRPMVVQRMVQRVVRDGGTRWWVAQAPDGWGGTRDSIVRDRAGAMSGWYRWQ